MPTAVQFLGQLLLVAKAPSSLRSHASFIIDVALLHSQFSLIRPSRIACAALCLANAALGNPFCLLTTAAGKMAWPATLEAFAGITLAEIKHYVRLLHKAINDVRKMAAADADEKALRAVAIKYSALERDFASHLPLSVLDLIFRDPLRL